MENEFRIEEIPTSCSMIVIGEPGSGKCLGKDTLVRLYYGECEKVQNLQVGDQLMGDDSKPRTILSLGRGRAKMYEIVQDHGSNFVCNGDHILVLYDTKTSTIVEKSVNSLLEDDMRDGISRYRMFRYALDGNITIDNFSDIGRYFFSHTFPHDLDLDTKLQILGAYVDNYAFYIKTNMTKHLSLFLPLELDAVHRIESFIASCGFGTSHNLSEKTSIINIYGDLSTIYSKKWNFDKVEYFGSPFDIVKLSEDEYFGFQIDGNGRFLLSDYTVSHNTTFIDNLVYYNRSKYPTGKIYSKSEMGLNPKKGYMRYTPELWMRRAKDLEQVKTGVSRQLSLVKIDHPFSANVLIMDDCFETKKDVRERILIQLFKQGTRHFNQLTVLGSQMVGDFPDEVRSSASYIVLFASSDGREREKLYEMFGRISAFGNKATFFKVFDDITKTKYRCMVIKKLGNTSSRLEDCVFYYDVKPLENIVQKHHWYSQEEKKKRNMIYNFFGCVEWRELWVDERFDKKSTEPTEFEEIQLELNT